MITGLTLGKFAPLHKGHQFLIETAMKECDRLYVVIYDAPETTPIPLTTRAQWIRDLYSRTQVKVIEAWDGPSDTGNTDRIKKIQEDYIRGLIGNLKIDRFYSSEFYGEHMAKALGAEDCRVDSDRTMVPVSGAKIREDPWECRAFIEPIVYRDLITKAVFLGAPCTGKTTLAEACAKRFNTEWMPEYGREYWEEHQVNRRLSMPDLNAIAEGHVARENLKALEARDVLFIDTNALTTRQFALYYHGFSSAVLDEMARACSFRYDLVFLCDDDFEYQETWDRSGPVNRMIFQKQIRADLNIRKTPFISLSGTLEQRISRVGETLARFNKWNREMVA